MVSTLIAVFLTSFVFAVVFTPAVAAWARRWGIVDVPDADVFNGQARKLHARPTPLLGGVAVFAAFAITTAIIAWRTGAPFAGRISSLELGAVLIAGIVLVFGGVLDDAWRLRPWQQFCFPLLAVGLTAAAGVGVTRVTNPFGGIIALAPTATVAFTVLWLLGTTYTTKLLDGLDGLVAGITAIGALLIAALSLTHRYFQPDVAVLALAFAGATLGFLIFNIHPARVFLGEGGSTLCGFLLGTLAIISGGKIATALLVMGIPALDVAFVIGARFVRRRSPFASDRRHLHFRLLDVGWTHRQAVALLWAFAAAFGSLTLLLQSSGKLIVLIALAAGTAALSGFVGFGTMTRALPRQHGRGS